METEQSFLRIYDYSENSTLISNSIDEIKDKLLVNPNIIVYGKICNQHRSIGFFSNDSIGYQYSGQLAKSQKIPLNLEILLNKINEEFNTKFNGILVNKYLTGEDYIGAHSDDERFLDKSGVFCISFGESRIFRIRDKITKKKVLDIKTQNNEIIHMGGDFQKEFTHEIPIEKKVKNERYSLTFRNHLN